jgi:hypothetical protein
MDLSLVISFVIGIVAGGIAALKVIAPKTANTVDDKVLEKLELIEGLLGNLKK